jgi:hypothetical protein
MKARISQLHKTEAEWQNWLQWIPESGEFIVYSPDEAHPFARIKLGDGKRTLKELDFFIDSAIEEILKQVRFSDTVDGGRITEYSK